MNKIQENYFEPEKPIEFSGKVKITVRREIKTGIRGLINKTLLFASKFKLRGLPETILNQEPNTISSDLLELQPDKMQASVDNSLDDLFTINEVEPFATMLNKDGIILFDNDATQKWYTCISSTSQPSSTTLRVTGTFTGFAVAVDGAAKYIVGFDVDNAGAFTTGYAVENAGAVTLGAGDSLTIQWDISVS